MAEKFQEPREKCTPFAFFVDICNKHCSKKNPDKEVDVDKLSDLCWERWQRMSDLEKKRFIQLSQCDVTRYDKAMEEYEEKKKNQVEVKDGDRKEEKRVALEIKEAKAEEKRLVKKALADAKAKKEAKKAKKDPNAPKKAMASYMHFSNELRVELRTEQPELSMIEQAKEAGKRWNDMSPEAKEKYEKMAAEDKLRYEKELKNYITGAGAISPVKIAPAAVSSNQEDDSVSDSD